MQWQRIRQGLERESLKHAKEAERESQEWEFWKHAAESDFWRHFQGKFEALADEERTVVLKTHPDRGLRAYCVYNSDRTAAEAESIRQGVLCLLYRFESGKWSLSDGPNENFKARYEALATRAGIRLCPPRDARPLDFWLHSLCLQLRRTDSPTLFARSDTGGIITRSVSRPLPSAAGLRGTRWKRRLWKRTRARQIRGNPSSCHSWIGKAGRYSIGRRIQEWISIPLTTTSKARPYPTSQRSRNWLMLSGLTSKSCQANFPILSETL